MSKDRRNNLVLLNSLIGQEELDALSRLCRDWSSFYRDLVYDMLVYIVSAVDRNWISVTNEIVTYATVLIGPNSQGSH